MAEPIMVACDLHDKTMLLKVARGRAPAETITVRNTRAGRERMIADFEARARKAGGAQIIFAYEASGQGFGLYDELTEAEMQCHVLAPTKIARSTQHRRQKNDDRDGEQILQLLRGHVLAGNPLPKVWIPDPQTRDDREAVRARLDAAEKLTGLKAQVQSLLKRNRLARPEGVGAGWTNSFKAWLRGLCRETSQGVGMREALSGLLRQLDFLEEEIQRLDQAIVRLAESPRYQRAVMELVRLRGVGVLTALVFLTEIGDLGRFANRRQIGAYLGLVPGSYESGSQNDRKGHITRQGPSRVRKVLCQATWARVRDEGPDQAAYRRIVERNPKHKKIAVVAAMRRLAVRMWHAAREAPAEAIGQPPGPPKGRLRSRGGGACAPPPLRLP